MSDLVQVGLVGLGTIAETHLAVLAERSDVSLEFTVDPHVEQPPAFRGAEPPHYRGLSDALEAHQPDLVVIATPTNTHAELTVEALTSSSASILVEKPLVADLTSSSRLRSLDDFVDVRRRVFTAHHFAFSPEVDWAVELIGEHPEWGPVTTVTSAFHDPYAPKGEKAFASYVSSWMDSGVNQLSMLSRFVEPTGLVSGDRRMDGGASSWATFAHRSRGTTGTARLRSSWLTGSSSKETVLAFGRSGVEVWLDHTSMTGFAAQGASLLAAHGNDGRTPRKLAHYRPLYQSLLSGDPDPVLGFDTTVTLTELHSAP